MKKRPALRWLVPSSPNPIVVKELRQAVRSRFVSGTLIFFLFILLATAGALLLTARIAGVINPSTLLSTGRTMFHSLFAVLSAACIYFVPAYSGIRLAMERSNSNLDLLYVTTISPGRIIRGKLLAGTIITIILFSAALPFMSVTFLLRGIDLPSISIVLIMTFLVVLFAVQGVVFLACIPCTRAFKALIGLAVAGGLSALIITVNWAAATMLESGVGSLLRTRAFWEPALLILAGGLVLFGLIHVFAVALVTPPSANRALPIRLYLTVVWLVSGIAAVKYCFFLKEGTVIFAWAIPSIILLSAAMLMAISERAASSRRVRRAIPRPLWRPLAFLFYSGSAGGILWVITLASATFGIVLVTGLIIPPGDFYNFREALLIWKGVFLYMFAYAMTGLLLWRALLRNRVPESTKWVLALLVTAACSIVPTVVACSLAQSHRDVTGAWFLGNVFALADPDYRVAHVIVAGSWAILFTAINLPWILRQIRAFRPLSDGE